MTGSEAALRPLPPALHAALRPWFQPERPGPLVGMHVIQTGHGRIWTDRWPAPRVVLAETAGNFELRGDATVAGAVTLPPLAEGFFAAAEALWPVIGRAFPAAQAWYRLIFEQPRLVPVAPPAGYRVRRLVAGDGGAVARLSADVAWIANTWGGPAGLACGGHAWGAFDGRQLVSVACSFFVGAAYEDLGVVTEAGWRRRGLSAACAAALCGDIHGRGRRPSWSTSVENRASMGVARKLGFFLERQDQVWVFNRPVPADNA